MPKQLTEFKFVPLKKFTWERKLEDGSKVFMGEYHPGQSYNCTKEPRHDSLRAECRKWEKDKMIVIIPLAPGQQFISVGQESEE